MYRTLCSISLLLFPAFSTAAPQIAFPGAEGYGKYTVGGRGGDVHEVTNLNDSGLGSLREAVEASGPRTVVFRVSGTIDLMSDLRISNPYLTIAGQTAPGDGICIKRYPLNISADEVIIRYIRVRYGDDTRNGSDAISSRYIQNLIMDHVSASWGDDETMSIYHCENVTVQWCMITETLNRGGSHGFAAIWGSHPSSYHHNLIAHHVSRNPRWASGCGNVDYRNNVLYNWGYNSCYGGEAHQVGDRRDPPIEFSNINMVANYYKPGPGTETKVQNRIADPSSRDGDADAGRWWVSGNVVEGSAAVTADNWQGVTTSRPAYKLTEPWPAMEIAQQTAEDAYESVLEGAGAILPKRDSLDARIVDETRNGTATYGNNGIIESQTEVGGWPQLNSHPAPADADHDGMPDEWETRHGLDPDDEADRNGDFDNDGFTNLEEYLNEIGAFRAVEDINWSGTINNRYALVDNWSNGFQPSHLDSAIISGSKVIVDTIGQRARTLQLNDGASVDIESGSLEVNNLDIGMDCALRVAPTGTLRLSGSGSITMAEGSILTNDGLLDIISWEGTLPSQFVNTGTVLDRSTVRVVSVDQSPDGQIKITIVGYRGHRYQLQSSNDLTSSPWSDLGEIIPGAGVQIEFTIAAGNETQAQYFRVRVD